MVYDHYSTLNNLITICTHLLLTCLLSNRYSNLFNRMIMFFSIDLKDVYLHIPIVKHHHHFLCFVCNKNLSSGKFYLLHWLQSPRFSYYLLNLYCSFARCKGFHVIIHLDYIPVPNHLKHAGKGHEPFFDLYWFILFYIIIFPNLNLVHSALFIFRTMFGYSGYFCIINIRHTS